MAQELPIAQFAVDKEQRVTSWNNACHFLTGCPASAALGTKRHQEFFGGSDGLCLVDALLRVREGVNPGTLLGQEVQPVALQPGAWWQEKQSLPLVGNTLFVHYVVWLLYNTQGQVTGAVQTIFPETALETSAENKPLPLADYRILAENIGDGFLLNQNEKLVLVNKAFANLLGYADAEELIGLPIAELIAPSHREIFLQRHYGKLSGEFFARNTWPHLTKQGTVVWLEGHPKRIVWNGQHAILSTLINVTEAYEREQHMQKEAQQLRQENQTLKSSLKKSYNFHKIIGRSASMEHVYGLLLRAAADTATVLIYGESGTGKELAAQAIHGLGARAKEPFVAINCGAIPAELLESEFFGAKRGAFTGAYAGKVGYLAQAKGGTLFLDEVGDLPLPLQVKLLRALDQGGYYPVGSAQTLQTDVRIIAATNRNLVADVAAGRFREDLFYRLHVIPIHMPPLRERKEDIPLLLEYFFSKYAPAGQHPVFPAHMVNQLYAYDWPGNVREFMNTVQRYLTLGTLDLIHQTPQPLPLTGEIYGEENDSPGAQQTLHESLQAHEHAIIQKTLQYTKGNRSKAAQLLGISRRHLYRKILEYT